jgi:4-carboxymuconolactone decarboxylase
MLAMMSGVESQLRAHIRISMNVGVSTVELEALGHVPDSQVDVKAGRRVHEAVAQVTEAALGRRVRDG